MKNKKAFTLIELLAVIVVLGIIMLIAVTSVSGVLEKARKDAYIATAKSYVDAVRRKVLSEGIDLPATIGGYTTVYLSSGMVEKGGLTSPYGNNFILKPSTYTETDISNANSNMNTALSNVRVTCTEMNDGICRYSYSIFLSDGRYATGCYDDDNNIGVSTDNENNLNTASIKTLAVCP